MTYEGPYEMMNDVEETQCITCSFRKESNDDGIDYYPMCYEVEGLVIQHENVVAPLVTRPDGYVTCTKYRIGDPIPPIDKNQLSLFDL